MSTNTNTSIKDEKVRIIAIIDMSGSMHSVRNSVIKAFNGFIAEQKTFEGDVDISLIVFNNAYRVISKNVPIRDFPEMTQSTYSPSGGTAMYDSIVKCIKEFKDSKNVVMLIQTDGEENESSTYNLSDVRTAITGKINDGWDISFLGANIDAKKVGNNLGVLENKCIQYNNNAEGLDSIFATMNTASALYRSDRLNESKGD